MATSVPDRPALRARYESRQAAVVAAAATLFATKGYQSTSIADLTAATGLTAGGIYHYIGSKERLLELICDDLLSPLLVQARAIVSAGESAEETLREILRTWLAHIAAHRDHMLVFNQERNVIESQPRWRHIRRQRQAFEKILDGVLAAGEAAGTMEFEDRRLTLLALLGMVNYSAQWMRGSGRLSPQQIADGYCSLILGQCRRG